MMSKGNALKSGGPTTGFSFTTMLQHTCQGFLSKEQCENTGPSPISPELAASDIYLFPGLKTTLKRRRFCDATDILMNATEELKRLPQNGFQKCFQHLYSCWQKCTVAREEYF